MCMEESTKKATCANKLKRINNFLIHCSFYTLQKYKQEGA